MRRIIQPAVNKKIKLIKSRKKKIKIKNIHMLHANTFKILFFRNHIIRINSLIKYIADKFMQNKMLVSSKNPYVDF